MENQQGGGAYGEDDDDGIPFVCQFITNINSRGIWFGDDPFSFSVPLLMLQLSLISIFNRCIQLVLKPFGQPSIVSQILGGVILGPSVIGRSSLFSAYVFPTTGRGVFETFASFGFVLYVFLIGVKTDPSIIMKSSRRTLAIGVLGYFLPYSVATLVALILNHFLSLDESISKDIYLLASMLSMTAFPVITCFLTELKILNSEIGRTASSSSIICDLCHWSITSLKYAIHLSTTKPLKISIGSFFSIGLLISFIIFGIRPVALWVVRHTSEGKPVKELYIFAVFVALLTCGFLAEAIGLGAVLASLFLGLAIPDGPPLGATLVHRLDCFVSIVLMPIFFATSGLKVDVYAIQSLENVGVIQLLVFVTFFAKFAGTIMPPLLLRMPVRDAIALGFIMNSKGIVELGLLNNWKIAKVLNKECYAIMIISVVIVTGVISPIVKVLYDPSRRFVAYKRRTVMHNRQKEELRMLACIHSEDNVSLMQTLLNASNPTKESPISLIVLHLIKLEGRASSLLIPHFPHEKSHQNPRRSQRIFDAFMKFEKDNQDYVTLYCYEGVSPYATMHNDVCSLALEKRTTLIIIPFHTKWNFTGKAEASSALRHLNKNVLDKAPCSVGILINRGNMKEIYQPTYWESPYYRIVVLFFGGADDREALAYAERMSEHPSILLTVIRFSSSIEIVGGTTRSKILDNDILKDFRYNAQRNARVSYQEEDITDKADILSTFGLLKDGYDLVMVGRRHGESNFMQELRKSGDIEHRHEELGIISNILVGIDIRAGFSILLLQQQTKVWGLRDPEESSRLRRVNLKVTF